MGREAWEWPGTSRHGDKSSEPAVRGPRPENSHQVRAERSHYPCSLGWREAKPSRSCLRPWPGTVPGPARAPLRLSPGARSPAPVPGAQTRLSHPHSLSRGQRMHTHTPAHPRPPTPVGSGHGGTQRQGPALGAPDAAGVLKEEPGHPSGVAGEGWQQGEGWPCSASPGQPEWGPLTGEGLCLRHPRPSPCSDLVPSPDAAPCPLPASRPRKCGKPHTSLLTPAASRTLESPVHPSRLPCQLGCWKPSPLAYFHKHLPRQQF